MIRKMLIAAGITMLLILSVACAGDSQNSGKADWQNTVDAELAKEAYTAEGCALLNAISETNYVELLALSNAPDSLTVIMRQEHGMEPGEFGSYAYKVAKKACE